MKACAKCGKPINRTEDYMQSADKGDITFHKWCYLYMKPAEIMKYTGPFGGYNLHNDAEEI